jgi:biopolymer transport protein ExbB
LAGALVVIFPALLAIAATLAFSAPAAQAQQDKETVSDVDPAARPPQAARPPVDAGKAADAAAAPRPRRSYLGWLYESLGLLYSVIFLVLSFALVAFFVMNLLIARRESVLPSDLIEGFESLLNAKKYQEAYELAKNDESFLGHVLSAGLARVSSGYE